jgi:hypothetical protein
MNATLMGTLKIRHFNPFGFRTYRRNPCKPLVMNTYRKTGVGVFAEVIVIVGSYRS